LSQLIRNRTTERDIRVWLNENGHYGNSAKFLSVELFAIEPPGWKQVFEFHAQVRRADSQPGEWTELWGVVVDDDRRSTQDRTQISIFESPDQQRQQLEIASSDLMTLDLARKRKSNPVMLLALAGIFILGIIIVVAITRAAGR